VRAVAFTPGGKTLVSAGETTRFACGILRRVNCGKRCLDTPPRLPRSPLPRRESSIRGARTIHQGLEGEPRQRAPSLPIQLTPAKAPLPSFSKKVEGASHGGTDISSRSGNCPRENGWGPLPVTARGSPVGPSRQTADPRHRSWDRTICIWEVRDRPSPSPLCTDTPTRSMRWRFRQIEDDRIGGNERPCACGMSNLVRSFHLTRTRAADVAVAFFADASWSRQRPATGRTGNSPARSNCGTQRPAPSWPCFCHDAQSTPSKFSPDGRCWPRGRARTCGSGKCLAQLVADSNSPGTADFVVPRRQSLCSPSIRPRRTAQGMDKSS